MENLCRYAVMLTILILLSPGCQKQNDVPKHIFFIVIDALRADHLGCYGYKQSTAPAIDRLASLLWFIKYSIKTQRNFFTFENFSFWRGNGTNNVSHAGSLTQAIEYFLIIVDILGIKKKDTVHFCAAQGASIITDCFY